MDRASHVPSILCPVDFSEPSRTALRYASAIADHFGARLTLLAVDDPLLVEAAAATGLVPSVAQETERELQRFCGSAIGTTTGPKTIAWRVETGKPALEILRVARELGSDLIVMGSRGHSGLKKMFFGSTTERVLRETEVPVLVTPDVAYLGQSMSEMARHVNRVVAPVDLTAASSHQVTAAAAIAGALSVPLILAHVVEPIFIPFHVRVSMIGAGAARRVYADEQLEALKAQVSPAVSTETVVISGDPAEEIVKLAETRHANLLVVGLHSSEPFGPRMGSVTYRVLCLTTALVLALPPRKE